jgi:ribosome maturation factor RimP
MILQSSITELINDKLEADGYFFVNIEIKPSNDIIVFIDNDKGVSVDYCAEISRLIENSFDREIEDFSLEVSSPGLGQPFKVLKQYKKNIGKEVEVFTNKKVKIIGILTDASEDYINIKDTKKVKVDGSNKKELQITLHQFGYEEIKYVKEIIKF